VSNNFPNEFLVQKLPSPRKFHPEPPLLRH